MDGDGPCRSSGDRLTPKKIRVKASQVMGILAGQHQATAWPCAIGMDILNHERFRGGGDGRIILKTRVTPYGRENT